MNNSLHERNIIDLTAPYEVTGGDGVLRGNLFGIATSWARQGEPVATNTASVLDLTRALDHDLSIGDPIFRHDESRCFTRDPKRAVKVGVAVLSTHGMGHTWVRGKLISFVIP